jgi:dipeptidyl-peptidase-4
MPRAFPLLEQSESTAGTTSYQKLSLAEQMKLERMRDLSQGVRSYSWMRGDCYSTTPILIPIQGSLYVQYRRGEKLVEIFNKGCGDSAIDPMLSPDGKLCAFVKGGEIFVVPATEGSACPSDPIQVTKAREVGIVNGMAEFIAEEEMSRFKGYWWSPDSKSIAYCEVDDRHIPVYHIIHQGEDEIVDEQHRYPFAGKDNAIVKLAISAVDDICATRVIPTEPVYCDLRSSSDYYIARVGWMPNNTVWCQVQSRDQCTLELQVFNKSGHFEGLVLRETSSVYINLHDLLSIWSDPADDKCYYFIWGSERTQFMHLYLYRFDSTTKICTFMKPITSGPWLVEELSGVDTDKGVVYFCGTKDSPLERHLYSVNIAGEDEGKITKITAAPGWHQIVLDHKFRRFVDTYSSLSTKPVTYVVDIPTATPVPTTRSVLLHECTLPPIVDALLVVPQVISIPSTAAPNGDNSTLFAAVLKPDPTRWGPGPYPTIVSVYGGPHVQKVQNQFKTTIEMRAQVLRDHGYLVVRVDNRGSARRGLAFESAIHLRMGLTEVQDQKEALKFLIENNLVIFFRFSTVVSRLF